MRQKRYRPRPGRGPVRRSGPETLAHILPRPGDPDSRYFEDKLRVALSFVKNALFRHGESGTGAAGAENAVSRETLLILRWCL